jgi:tripartite-type tricarboxylate transporter receptor subunit TctC
VIGTVPREIATAPFMGNGAARYEPTKLSWIATPTTETNACLAHERTGMTSYKDLFAKELIVGDAGAGNGIHVYPTALKGLFGMKFRLVPGYSTSAEIFLAMERGEIDGIYTHAGTFRPDRIASGEILPLLQSFPIEPGLPSLQDAKEPRAHALFDLLTAPSRIGAPVVAPPNLPKEITSLLRDAYVAMGSSKEYVEEANKRGIDIGKPSHGADLQEFVAKSLGAIPRDVVEEYKAYVGMK